MNTFLNKTLIILGAIALLPTVVRLGMAGATLLLKMLSIKEG
jgi:hypothetical protein